MAFVPLELSDRAEGASRGHSRWVWGNAWALGAFLGWLAGCIAARVSGGLVMLPLKNIGQVSTGTE